MQRKKLLSVCVAMALSGQTWATDTSILDITDDTRKSSKITCPANIHSISKEQLAKLPSECRDSDDSAVMSWTAAGLVAVVTGAAVMALNDGDHHDSSEPDDGGGFAPIFPDICYHLTHYKPAAADIPVASDNPAHYADAIRYNARTPLQGSLLPLTRLVWA